MLTRKQAWIWAVAVALNAAAVSASAQNTAQETVGARVGVAPPAAPEGWTFDLPEDMLVDNGPLVTHPGGGSGGADASAVQNVSLGMTTLGLAHQDTSNARIADDFTVPAGETWEIATAVLYAYQTGAPTPTSPLTGVNVQIWDGPPNGGGTVVFGDTSTNRLLSSVFTNIYRVAETGLTDTNRAIWANTVALGVTVSEGTYWIDWQVAGSASYSGPWAPPITVLGQTTTGNALQFFGGVWGNALDGGTATGQGFPFQLFPPAAAAALAIEDSAGNGNGILEPGETAGIQPSWQAGIGVLGVMGTAVATSGDYTLLDGNATYGDMATNTTVSCTAGADCYEAAADGMRMLTHWDLTLQETLSTPTAEMHDWALHVGSSFGDMPASDAFYPFVETLLHNGVTSGCGGSTYCPTDVTSRAQMAVFVLKAAEGPGYVPPACVAGSEMFADVPATSPFCPFIEELARRGVAAGCGGGNYCPDDPTTRGQMPVFSLRTLEGAAYSPAACVAGSEVFADVPATDPFCRWIEEYSRRGITAGCGGGLYCPTDGVTRGQMAVFQTKTFDLLIYGP